MLIYIYSGVKWKENIDLMCCLPNKFPLPIILLINKFDTIEPSKRKDWSEKLKIDNYMLENQFFYKYFLISNKEKIHQVNEDGDNNDVITDDTTIPFKKISKFVLDFEDIRNIFPATTGNNNQMDKEANGKDKKGGKKEGKDGCVMF